MLPDIQNKQGIVHIFNYLIAKTIMKYRFAIVLTILISSKVLGQRIEKEFFASTSNCLLTKHRLNVISIRENFLYRKH